MAKQESKIMLCHEFITKFLSQKLTNLYYIYGSDDYLKQKAAKTIIDRAISPDKREFDYISLYGNDMSVADTIDVISTKPFIAEHKVIFINKFDKLKTTDQQKIIEEFIKNNIDNILVIVSETFDSRLKLSKLILNNGRVVQCKSPYKPEDMIPWLNQEVRSSGKTLDYQAALLFVNKLDLNYNYATNELEKLVLYCKDSTKITVSDVQVCTGDSKINNIFDFIDNIGEKNERQSFLIMENLMNNNEAPIFIITMLTRFFCQMWRISYLQKQGHSDYIIISNHLSDIHSFFRKKYLNFARHYSLQHISEIFSLLLEADTEIKSTNLEDSLIIERMLFRLFRIKDNKKNGR